jgi:signal transduction histidine kinase/CheY-like chemotaxis protein
MPDPDAAKHDSYLERYERTREARFIGKRREVTGRHKDGRPIEIEVAIAEIRVGDEVLFSGIVQDVTERKEVDRLKSEFVSTVTHELRTPMTSIMGSLGLLRGGALGPLSEKAERMINLAHDNGTRLVSLINDILDIDKIEAGQLEFRKQSLNLKSLIEQSVNLNAACARENGAAIVVEAVDDDIFIDADPDRFQQVMGNLLSNAAKFSPRGGKVTITAIMKGPVVRVDVADQGPGIPLEFQPRIFQKFAQADSSDTRQKGGTGLGLNIAKAIVERLGGRIGFETEIGAGTKFYFDLLGRREAVASPSASHPAPASDMSGVLQVIRETDGPQSALPRVLHVEDDADTCAVVAECISDIAQVTAVPTAEEAREILMENSFNLVILDMLLPGENGDSVLRYLLERSTPPPRVLVFSGYEMAVDKWPPVTLALVKSRTDIVALRRHVLELLHGESASPPLKRSA